MPRVNSIVLLLFVLFSLNSCSSILVRYEDYENTSREYKIFLGVQNTTGLLKQESHAHVPFSNIFKMMFFIDYPLSLIVDTVSLPYDIVYLMLQDVNESSSQSSL